MAKYIPPRSFNMVADGIYRSIIPNELNYPFLERLKLKTIIYLSSETVSPALSSFCSDVNIKIVPFVLPQLERQFPYSINESVVVEALNVILNGSSMPLLIMSNQGSNTTGVVVACLRKKQKWNLTSIFEEYRRYDGPKSNLESEQFIELFDPDLVAIGSDKQISDLVSF